MVDDILLEEEVEQGRPVTLAEVRQMLEDETERRETMTYEQKIALEHARRFARVDFETAKKMLAKLESELTESDEAIRLRIVDMCPVHADDVRAIYQKTAFEVDEALIEKVIAIVDEFYVA